MHCCSYRILIDVLFIISRIQSKIIEKKTFFTRSSCPNVNNFNNYWIPRTKLPEHKITGSESAKNKNVLIEWIEEKLKKQLLTGSVPINRIIIISRIQSKIINVWSFSSIRIMHSAYTLVWVGAKIKWKHQFKISIKITVQRNSFFFSQSNFIRKKRVIAWNMSVHNATQRAGKIRKTKMV